MGAHNDTANDYQLFNMGAQTIADPGSGGTFDLRGIDRGVATIASGTRKLPNNIPLGVKFFVHATGSVTIQTAASVTVVTLATGQIGEFTSKTATTWVATVHAVGGTPLTASDVDFSNGATDATNVDDALAAILGVVTPHIIQVPLTSLREVSTMAVGNVAAIGGVLASDTTPVLGPINGATAGCQRVRWASSNNDVVMFQVALPPNIDEAQDITLSARIASGGTTNAVGFTVTSYFGEDGAAVSDTTGTNQTATYATVTATIAAADVTNASVLTISLTPVAHTTDTLDLTGLWLSVPVLVASP